eukprot:1576915-Amphidinium_carterae.1
MLAPILFAKVLARLLPRAPFKAHDNNTSGARSKEHDEIPSGWVSEADRRLHSEPLFFFSGWKVHT